MDQRGVSATIGVVLLVAIAVTMAAGAALFIRAPEGGPDQIDASGRARIVDGDHVVTWLGPDDLALQGSWINAETPNGSIRIELAGLSNATADGQYWRVGESICLTGLGAACALPPQAMSRITVYAPQQLLFSLRFEAGSAPAPAPGPTPALAPIETCFDILSSGAVATHCQLAWTSVVVGSQITQGVGGATINTYLSARPNNATPYTQVYNGNKAQAGDAEWIGTWPSDSRIGLLGEAKLGSYYRSYESSVSDPHVMVLRDGDPVPQKPGYAGQVPVGSMLEPYTKDGNISIGPHEVIYLFEFNDDLTAAAADYQDLVVLLRAAYLD